MGFLVFITVVIELISIAACAILADKKGRSVGGWIVGGIFLGWFGFIILCCLSNRSLSEYEKMVASGYQSTRYQRSNAGPHADYTKKRPIPTARVAKYRCEACGETVDTPRCPYCGAERSK